MTTLKGVFLSGIVLLGLTTKVHSSDTPAFVVQSQGIGMIRDTGVFSLMVVTIEGGVFHRQKTFRLDDSTSYEDSDPYTRPIACDERAYSFLSRDNLSDLIGIEPTAKIEIDVMRDKLRIVDSLGHRPSYSLKHSGAEVSGITCIYAIAETHLKGVYRYQLIENQADLEIAVEDQRISADITPWLRGIERDLLNSAARRSGFFSEEELPEELRKDSSSR